MAKLLILFISLAVLAGSIEGRFPSKYRVLYPRSIPEGAKGPEPSSKEIDSLDSKELIPKNLLNTPKDLKGEEPYGQEGRQKGYPKGGPESLDGPYGPQGEGPEGPGEYGPRGPSRRDYSKRRREGGPDGYPGGPEGPGGYGPPRGGPGDEGLGFGPDGPCMSKRCNPFRSRKPSYRAYLQRLMSRKMGNDGPYGPPPPPMHLPMIEEVIIVRRIPVILSKLLIAVALDPSKFKKEEGGKPGDGKEPVGPPAPVPEYGNEEEVLPKDQPYGDKKKEGYADLTKSKQGPKDKEFDESMGEEELVAKKYSSQGEKDEKEEKKLEPYSNKDKEIKLKYDEKEYLEKPGKYGEGNDLEPRSSELKKEKESNANKIEP